MSDIISGLPSHNKLIKAFGRVNADDELGQMKDKARQIAILEGKEVTSETLQENLDELIEISKQKSKESQEPLSYPEQF